MGAARRRSRVRHPLVLAAGAAALLLSANPSRAEDWKFLRRENGVDVYLGTSSITVSGSIRRVLLKSEKPDAPPPGDPPSIRYTISTIEVDCKESRLRVTDVTFHYSDGTQQEASDGDDAEWHPVDPRATTHTDLVLICSL